MLGCKSNIPYYIGDGYCDDQNNNEGCHFDQGDCCGNNVTTTYCTQCICFENITCSAPLELISNGVCNDETNNAQCEFDGGDCCGGDCCGHCEVISITLENNAKAAQGIREGIYHNSFMVKGKASWISTSNAIWYTQSDDLLLWMIGDLGSIGNLVDGLISFEVSQCPFNVPSEIWYYWIDGVFANAGGNEINVRCLDGKYPKSIHFQKNFSTIQLTFCQKSEAFFKTKFSKRSSFCDSNNSLKNS